MPTAVNPAFTPDMEGPYVVRLTVTDPGGLTDSDDVTITAEPPMAITGVWTGVDETGATWTLTLVEEQGTGSVSGEAELSYLGTVILGGGVVFGSRTGLEVELTVTFSGYAPAVFTGTLSADGGTLEGQLNGSGYENSALTLTRISGSSPAPAAVSEPVVPGNDLLAEFLRGKVKI
jgi:PKD repeat protein